MQQFIAQLGLLQERFNLLAEASRAQFKTLGVRMTAVENGLLRTEKSLDTVLDRVRAVEVALEETQVDIRDTRQSMVQTSEAFSAWVQNFQSHLETVSNLFQLIMESWKRSDDLEARLNARFEALEKRLPPENP